MTKTFIRITGQRKNLAKDNVMVQRITLAIMLAGVASCGVDELGVRAVNFELAATAVPVAPDGIDGAAIAAMSASHGSVAMDTHEDSGIIEALGLPDLPEGFSYGVILQFASEEREHLGGGSGGGGGHSHGALTLPGSDVADGAEELTAMPVGELDQEFSGHWEATFGSGQIGSSVMGALRGAMIMLQPPTGPAVMIMSGVIEIGGSASKAGGHTHGV